MVQYSTAFLQTKQNHVQVHAAFKHHNLSNAEFW